MQCKLLQQRRLYADDSKSPFPTENEHASPNSVSKDVEGSNLLGTEAQSTSSPSLPASQPHPEDVHPDTLPSGADSKRSDLNHRLSHIMDNLQSNIFIASQRINDLTGYSGIESLKTRIDALEKRSIAAQEAVRTARTHYKTVVASRASTQRETTTLLARKDSWTPIDLERFTNLYRMDHGNEQAVQEAARDLAEAERDAENLAGKLSASILARYHEEQIWSDKIRRMSTWGTWGLMGVNVLLFLVFQFGFEPWRRRRLVSGFEEKVLEALEKEKASRVEARSIEEQNPGVESVKLIEDAESTSIVSDIAEKSAMVEDTIMAAQAKSGEKVANAKDSIPEHVSTGAAVSIRDPNTWRPAVEDLFSPRLVQLRKQDVTTIALEGAATGAAIAAIIATLILRQS